MTPYTILIIDDEANQRLLLAHALCTVLPNLSVRAAASGEEAWTLVADAEPDLIIADYNMPQMNGLDFIAQIREKGIGSRIFLITAYSHPDLIEEASLLEVDAYLLKPVPLWQLRQLARAALDQ